MSASHSFAHVSSSCKRTRDDVSSSSPLGGAAVGVRRRRSRAVSDATTQHAEEQPWMPNNFQTPLRRETLDMTHHHPFDAPTRCRSPSAAMSDLDGLTSSDNSVHLLEIGFASHSACASNEEANAATADLFVGAAPPPLVLQDESAQQWQRELTQFFARLDQRPLCVVPVARDYSQPDA